MGCCLLDDLSQITLVLHDMSQIRTDMYNNYMDDLSPFFFSTWTICHNFILDDLSQVIFVTILFLTICHIWPLDDMSQKRSSDLGRCVGRYGRFATIVFSRDVLSQLSFVRGRFIVNLGKFNTFGMHPC